MLAPAATEAESNSARHVERETMIAVTCNDEGLSGRAQGLINTSGTRKSGSAVLGQFGGWLHNKLPRCQCNAVLVLANDPRRVEEARPFSENWKLGLCKPIDARSKDSRTAHCYSVLKCSLRS
jgi:hypothetical protein